MSQCRVRSTRRQNTNTTSLIQQPRSKAPYSKEATELFGDFKTLIAKALDGKCKEEGEERSVGAVGTSRSRESKRRWRRIEVTGAHIVSRDIEQRRGRHTGGMGVENNIFKSNTVSLFCGIAQNNIRAFSRFQLFHGSQSAEAGYETQVSDEVVAGCPFPVLAARHQHLRTTLTAARALTRLGYPDTRDDSQEKPRLRADGTKRESNAIASDLFVSCCTTLTRATTSWLLSGGD
ncbi:hypothetical protein WN51_06358 [Melipona quadrifasciata]|uniref:Uncharacterized protein n=1 Tax=Melipona quadrifasciata TaxID=166423 RepID=A0A0M9AAP4_9HYME|nr:hypothetical protein WN51_06358 [Melipona quadrifasciata]